MEEKKKTAKQLDYAIKNAVLHIPKDSVTKIARFDDMGVTITVTDDFALVSRNFAGNYFTKITGNGFSAPYGYLCALVELFLSYENDIKAKHENGDVEYHFAKLKEVAKTNEEKTLLNISEKYLYILCEPHFAIGNTQTETLNLLLMFNSLLAKNDAIFEGLDNGKTTANNFYNSYLAKLRYLALNVDTESEKRNPEELKEEVLKIETEALKQISNALPNYGYKLKDVFVFENKEDGE